MMYGKPYNNYEYDHAFCNAHLQIEHTGIEENYKQHWAKEMNALLTEMKLYTDECKEQIKNKILIKLNHWRKSSMLSS